MEVALRKYLDPLSIHLHNSQGLQFIIYLLQYVEINARQNNSFNPLLALREEGLLKEQSPFLLPYCSVREPFSSLTSIDYSTMERIKNFIELPQRWAISAGVRKNNDILQVAIGTPTAAHPFFPCSTSRTTVLLDHLVSLLGNYSQLSCHSDILCFYNKAACFPITPQPAFCKAWIKH